MILVEKGYLLIYDLTEKLIIALEKGYTFGGNLGHARCRNRRFRQADPNSTGVPVKTVRHDHDYLTFRQHTAQKCSLWPDYIKAVVSQASQTVSGSC